MVGLILMAASEGVAVVMVTLARLGDGKVVSEEKSSGLCSEETQAFFVGCGEVGAETVQSPFIKWAFLPVMNGICEDSSFF